MHGKHADNACVPCGGDAAGGALREARVASGWSTPRPHGHCEPPPFWQAFAQAGSSRPLFDPGVYGAVLSYEWKDALWDKFTMGTPDNSGGTSRSRRRRAPRDAAALWPRRCKPRLGCGRGNRSPAPHQEAPVVEQQSVARLSQLSLSLADWLALLVEQNWTLSNDSQTRNMFLLVTLIPVGSRILEEQARATSRIYRGAGVERPIAIMMIDTSLGSVKGGSRAPPIMDRSERKVRRVDRVFGRARGACPARGRRRS